MVKMALGHIFAVSPSAPERPTDSEGRGLEIRDGNRTELELDNS